MARAARRAPNDFTVTVCSVCGGTTLRRYGCRTEPDLGLATEFADCLTCGETYLYKRPAPPTPSAADQGGDDA